VDEVDDELLLVADEGLQLSRMRGSRWRIVDEQGGVVITASLVSEASEAEPTFAFSSNCLGPATTDSELSAAVITLVFELATLA
jgi:hypothetical protein